MLVWRDITIEINNFFYENRETLNVQVLNELFFSVLVEKLAMSLLFFSGVRGQL